MECSVFFDQLDRLLHTDIATPAPTRVDACCYLRVPGGPICRRHSAVMLNTHETAVNYRSSEEQSAKVITPVADPVRSRQAFISMWQPRSWISWIARFDVLKTLLKNFRPHARITLFNWNSPVATCTILFCSKILPTVYALVNYQWLLHYLATVCDCTGMYVHTCLQSFSCIVYGFISRAAEHS